MGGFGPAKCRLSAHGTGRAGGGGEWLDKTQGSQKKDIPTTVSTKLSGENAKPMAIKRVYSSEKKALAAHFGSLVSFGLHVAYVLACTSYSPLGFSWRFIWPLVSIDLFC